MKYKIDIAPLADYFVVAVREKETEELKETFTLNESGADMLRLLRNGMDTETVAIKIAELYEIPVSQIRKDVIAFADKMAQKQIL